VCTERKREKKQSSPPFSFFLLKSEEAKKMAQTDSIVAVIISLFVLFLTIMFMVLAIFIRLRTTPAEEGFNGSALGRSPSGSLANAIIYWFFTISLILSAIGLEILFVGIYILMPSFWHGLAARIGTISMIILLLIIAVPEGNPGHIPIAITGFILLISSVTMIHVILLPLPLITAIMLVIGYIYGYISGNWISFSLFEYIAGGVLVIELYVFYIVNLVIYYIKS